MKKTCNWILGGVAVVGVLAAIGAVTVARYAAKHMDRDVPDECDCDGDCEHCPMNDPDIEVEIEAKPEEANAEVAEPAVVVENAQEEAPVAENVEA